MIQKRKMMVVGLLVILLTTLLNGGTAVAAPPVIASDQVLTIPEHSPNGSSPTPDTIQATDPEGTNLTFAVTGGSGMGVFAVEASTGKVTVSNNSNLDRETNPSFTLQIEVTDEAMEVGNGTVTIALSDISDNPPVMENQTFNVAEHSPNGTTVGAIKFTDLDTSDTWTFTVTGGTGQGVFNVNSSNGIIFVSNNATLNHETNPSFTLNVEIKDKAGATDTATMTINVTNVNEPPVVNDQSFSVNEDSANGTVVGTIVASDPDSGDELTFALSGTPTPPFAVNPSTGQLTVSNSSQINTAGTSFEFTVTVTDKGTLSDTATITVNVTEVNDAPTTSGIADVKVNRNASPTTINLAASFADEEDEDSELVYTVQNNSNGSLFDSVGISGTTLTLNYAAGTSGTANITIRATDTGGKFVETTFKVTVNGPPTAANIPDVNVNEDAPNTQINLHNVFSDVEDADTALVYTIQNNTNENLFTSVAIDSPNLVLDYAPNAFGQATITVRATDTGGLFAEATVKVVVAPVNDTPTTSGISDVEVNEDAPNTVINLYSSFNDVEDDDEQMTYAVVNNTNEGLFDNVSISNGLLTLNYKNNATGVANITVRATDTGGASVETTFKVTVLPTNDPPTIDLNGNQSGTGFSAVYNTSGGPVLIVGNNLTVSDIDSSTIQSATITIKNRQNGSSERLTVNTSGTDIEDSINSNVLTLTGPDSLANFIQVLRTVRYENVSPDPDRRERQIGFVVWDEESKSNEAIATVNFISPGVTIRVTDAQGNRIQTIESGSTAVFNVRITNSGDTPLANIKVSAPQAPACETELDFSTLAVGQSRSYACFKENVTARFNNAVTVTAEDATTGGEVTASDTAVVRVEDPDIQFLVTPDPGSYTILVGGNATLDVYVKNTGPSELRNVTVTGQVRHNGSDEYEPFSACNRDIGTIPTEGVVEYQCTLLNVQQGFIVELMVTALSVAGNTTIEQFDIAEVEVLSLEVQVTTTPFEVLAGQPTDVVFNITVRNTGSKELSLQSLFSMNTLGQTIHGELTNSNNNLVKENSCADDGSPPLLGPNGDEYSCQYTARVTAQPPAYTAIIRAIAEDLDDPAAEDVQAEGNVTISVSSAQPVELTLTASPSSLVEPGGTVRLTASVRNNQSTAITLQSLRDSKLGNLHDRGTCKLPQSIAANSSYSCEYDVVISDLAAGDTVTHAVTAVSGSQSYNDDVVITITSRRERRILLPVVTDGYVAGEPNNSSCEAQPIAINTNTFFLPDDTSDWYSFTLTEESDVVVTLSNHVPGQGQLLLYSSNDEDCARPNYIKHNGDTYPPIITTRVVDLGIQPEGNYLIWVLTDVNFNSVQPYTLRVDATVP